MNTGFIFKHLLNNGVSIATHAITASTYLRVLGATHDSTKGWYYSWVFESLLQLDCGLKKREGIGGVVKKLLRLTIQQHMFITRTLQTVDINTRLLRRS